MLLLNPNYKNLLEKLKMKENMTSQLGRILKEPSCNKYLFNKLILLAIGNDSEEVRASAVLLRETTETRA
jgi:hypothetical protein